MNESGKGSGRGPRRMHSEAYKADIIRQCQAPGVSVSAIALANGLNTNLVRNWMCGVGVRKDPVPAKLIENEIATAPSFIELPIGGSACSQAIRVEVSRGDTRVLIDWPVSAAAAAGTWLRDLLR